MSLASIRVLLDIFAKFFCVFMVRDLFEERFIFARSHEFCPGAVVKSGHQEMTFSHPDRIQPDRFVEGFNAESSFSCDQVGLA